MEVVESYSHVGTWLSVLPPVLAIVLAILTRQVYIALAFGVFLGWLILHDFAFFEALAATINAVVRVFESGYNTKVILFSAMVGALIAFTQYSGGVQGFVEWIRSRKLITNQRRALLLSWLIGVVVFVESSITSLVNGAVSRPIFDQQRLSREKLAYLCDATAAPICVLIPLNAWGAYIDGLLTKEGFEAPIEILLGSMTYNFYPILTLVFSLVVIVWWRKDFGPMKTADERVATTGDVLRPGAEPVIAPEVMELQAPEGVPHRAINFVLPILTLVVMMPVGLYITGEGDMLAGSGSTSVLWAVMLATAVAITLSLTQRIVTGREATDLFFKGFGALLPLVTLLVFAFAIGDVAKVLGTGDYMAGIAADGLPRALTLPLLFVLACAVAFSTGTSWGTFAIMIPIGVPMAAVLGVPPEAAIGAVLGGGVFGDHCSPISDTTLVSSMAAGTDHIDHVRTQLPYALVVAAVAMAGYLVLGIAL